MYLKNMFMYQYACNSVSLDQSNLKLLFSQTPPPFFAIVMRSTGNFSINCLQIDRKKYVYCQYAL